MDKEKVLDGTIKKGAMQFGKKQPSCTMAIAKSFAAKLFANRTCSSQRAL